MRESEGPRSLTPEASNKITRIKRSDRDASGGAEKTRGWGYPRISRWFPCLRRKAPSQGGVQIFRRFPMNDIRGTKTLVIGGAGFIGPYVVG